MSDPSLYVKPDPVWARVTVHLWGMVPGRYYLVDPAAEYVAEKIAESYIVLEEPPE